MPGHVPIGVVLGAKGPTLVPSPFTYLRHGESGQTGLFDSVKNKRGGDTKLLSDFYLHFAIAKALENDLHTYIRAKSVVVFALVFASAIR